MNFSELNTRYWTNVQPEEIIGDNATPGEELLARLKTGSAILDIGCGNGKLAQVFATHGYRVTAVDLNQETIQILKKKEAGVTYLVGDVVDGLPFPDATFDAIVMSFVLVNLVPQSERDKAIREMFRLLKPGGHIWLNEGMTSTEYTHRYALSFPYTLEERSFFVFKDKHLSKQIQDEASMKEAIQNNLISRVAHHFTTNEMIQLFTGWENCYCHEASTQSPNTKMTINMATFVFKKR